MRLWHIYLLPIFKKKKRQIKDQLNSRKRLSLFAQKMKMGWILISGWVFPLWHWLQNIKYSNSLQNESTTEKLLQILILLFQLLFCFILVRSVTEYFIPSSWKVGRLCISTTHIFYLKFHILIFKLSRDFNENSNIRLLLDHNDHQLNFS